MSARLARVIRRILRGSDKAGLARVSAITRSGEVELGGRSERVLVAGNSMPAVGELAPWVRVDDSTLVTCKSVRSLFPALFMPAVGKQWEQVLVKPGFYAWDGELVHRDSSGRYWVKSHSFYFSQEKDKFTESPWTPRGQGFQTAASFAASCSAGQDAVLEFARQGIGISARFVHIDPVSGALTFDPPTNAYLHGSDKEGVPLDTRMVQDRAGYLHLATWTPSPYIGGGWSEDYLISDSPNSCGSWTWMRVSSSFRTLVSAPKQRPRFADGDANDAHKPELWDSGAG